MHVCTRNGCDLNVFQLMPLGPSVSVSTILSSFYGMVEDTTVTGPDLTATRENHRTKAPKTSKQVENQELDTTGPRDQRTEEAERQGTRGLRTQRTKELDNQATSQPENQGKQTSKDHKNPGTGGLGGPADQRTTGTKDQGTSGPENRKADEQGAHEPRDQRPDDQRTKGPED